MSDNITTKFKDFKDEKVKKFNKKKEFEPLSDDIIAIRELENGDIEKIKGPVEIVKVTGIITDPEKIKKIEEAVNAGPVFSTDLQVKEVKRGDIIHIIAFIRKSGTTSTWNAQGSQCIIRARIVDIYFGINKLNYINK